MKVSVAGSGYAALVASACFAEMGNLVTVYTPQQANTDALIREPGLQAMLDSNIAARRLSYTLDLNAALDECDVFILALASSLSTIDTAFAIAKNLGEQATSEFVFINRTSGEIGFTEQLGETINAKLRTRNTGLIIDVVANPDFLKEGVAIDDFMRPDRIVLGVSSFETRSKMSELFKPFSRQNDRLMFMGIKDVELTRFATSAMLATRISLMNEIAAIAEVSGVDIENVRRGIGADSRIGYSYLYPGVGYGGLALPDDVSSLIVKAEQGGISPMLLKSVALRNEKQADWAFKQLTQVLGSVSGKRIAIWGLSFRPETCDVTGSPAIVLIRQLLDAGAIVAAYDPLANNEAIGELVSQGVSEVLLKKLSLSAHQYDALPDADALVLMTEWKPFRQPDFNAIAKLLRSKIIIDGRNQYDPETLTQNGFVYRGVGRGDR